MPELILSSGELIDYARTHKLSPFRVQEWLAFQAAYSLAVLRECLLTQAVSVPWNPFSVSPDTEASMSLDGLLPTGGYQPTGPIPENLIPPNVGSAAVKPQAPGDSTKRRPWDKLRGKK